MRKIIETMNLTGAVVFDLALVDSKSLTFTASFAGDVIADNKGEPRKFGNVDDLYQAALAVNPGITSLGHTALDTVGLRLLKIPTNPIDAAKRHRTRMLALKAAAVARKAIATQVKAVYAPFDGQGNPAFQAAYDEAVAKEASLTAAVAYYDAQIAADTTLIGDGA